MSRTIEVKCLIPDKDNRKYGGTELIGTIADGNEKIYTPLLVAKGPKTGQYLVIDGHRRLASAIKAGLESVPCEILTPEEAERARAITNIDRQALSPLDQYTAICQLAEIGFDNGMIGSMLGISKYQVARRLQLNNLIDPLREKLLSGELSLEKAAEFAVVHKSYQKKAYERNERLVSSSYSAKDVRDAINQARGIALRRFTDEFMEEKGDRGLSCLECPMNPCTYALLFEKPDKAESWCTVGDYSCIAYKLANMCKRLGLDGICTSNEEIAKLARENGVGTIEYDWQRYEEPKPEWESYQSVLDDDGKAYYQCGKEREYDDGGGKEREERIDKLIEACEDKIESIFKEIVAASREMPIPLMPPEATMAILVGKERNPDFRVWDGKLGKDWDAATKRAGIESILSGKKECTPEDLAGKYKTDELVRMILLENDIWLLLSRFGLYNKESLIPSSYEVTSKRMDKGHLIESLRGILDRGKAKWGFGQDAWDRIHALEAEYDKRIEELSSIIKEER